MSEKSDPIDLNSGVVANVESTNEANIVVSVGNETLLDNRSNRSVVDDRVRVFGEGDNENSGGLRVVMEGLDVEMGSGEIKPSIDLGVNESTGNALDAAGRRSVQIVDVKNVIPCENLVGDTQGETAGDGNAVEGTAMQDVFGGKNDDVAQVVDIHENRDGLNVEQQVELKDTESIDVQLDALIPERRGNKHRREEEGKFCVSDLVWGKVRSHPWWPGQIFEPSAASDIAMKYFKKNTYLIGYFGDHTFAWNEASHIKPFRMYFSKMEKQSNSEAFSYAVDCALEEVSRRVEFGLACTCLLEETREKIKSQIVMNAGIREKSSLRVGGDSLSDVTSFDPAELVRLLKSLAAAPAYGINRLSFVLAKAQLRAFNHWKGYYELSVIEEFSESDDDVEPPLHMKKDTSDVAAVASKEILDLQGSSSTKCRRRSGIDEHPGKKEKLMSDLMSGSGSGIPNGQKRSRGRPGWKRNSLHSDKRHLAFASMPSGSKAKIRKLDAIDKHSEKLRNTGFGDSVLGPMEPDGEPLVPKEFPPPTEMLSKLNSAARNPMNAYSILISLASFFCDRRKFTCLETTELGDHTKTTGQQIDKKSSYSVSAENLSLEGIEDSYWTDRIIQFNPEDHVLFEPEVQNQEDFHNAKWGISPGLNPSWDNEEEIGGNPEYSPTALILNFSDMESVPPIADLNRIFSQYGPLCEYETKVLDKSKRAKVVFKRRADAETAFSKSGKFSIFGPSLISYRLDYSPSPRKASRTSKRRRKDASSIEANGVRN